MALSTVYLIGYMLRTRKMYQAVYPALFTGDYVTTADYI